MRVGPDGLPRPWAAESFTFVNDRTVDVTIRDGMTFHDGRPVTVDDVIFSFEAPMRTDKVPMFKPFVSDIEAIERTGERGLRFNLKQVNSAFATTALGRVFIAPKHVWEPHLKSVEGKPENIESIRDSANVGSGPFRQVRARLNEEIVLERFDKHWAVPKMDRLVVRIIPNAEAVIGMMRSGELNLLAEYGGDPEVLEALAKEVPAIKITQETDIGMEFLGFNNRRPPFSDPAFRAALSAAIDRDVLVQAAWNGFAVPSTSHVSPALPFWYAADVKPPASGVPAAREMLKSRASRSSATACTTPPASRRR
ncbi:MAG: ABC transporter substrate-binding protein [Microvirga sp.]